MKKHLIILSLLVLNASCGYHFEDPEQLATRYQTIEVPYVAGDQEGFLTDELVKAIGLSNRFTYAKGGELILQGTIVADQTTHIGWQYDREPTSGVRINRLVPNEGRREVTVQFSLIAARTGKVLCGPINVTAYSDFDFVDSDSLLDTSFLTPTGGRQSALFFSLGQLDSIQGAQSAALESLYQKLAYKIVRGMENIPFNLDDNQKLEQK